MHPEINYSYLVDEISTTELLMNCKRTSKIKRVARQASHNVTSQPILENVRELHGNRRSSSGFKCTGLM